jgi:hypothetical protein
MEKERTYIQFGCGLSAPKDWVNFDASPTLRIQKLPVIGSLLYSKLNVIFPENVIYGDIVKGLPVPINSCDGLYCSHTLEHLALEDLRIALSNSYSLLKPGCYFRCVVPDLEFAARVYLSEIKMGNPQASINFMNATLLGKTNRPRGLKNIIRSYFGNDSHLWMWDQFSLVNELSKVGFRGIRVAYFNDCKDEMFKLVEDYDRFQNAVAVECFK